MRFRRPKTNTGCILQNRRPCDHQTYQGKSVLRSFRLPERLSVWARTRSQELAAEHIGLAIRPTVVIFVKVMTQMRLARWRYSRTLLRVSPKISCFQVSF